VGGGGYRIISRLTSSFVPSVTFQLQFTWPGRLCSAPTPCWLNDLRRCNALATSSTRRTLHRTCDSTYVCRRQHQWAPPLQSTSSRPLSRRFISFTASHRQNSWTGVVRVYATTLTNHSSVVISSRDFSTSSRVITWQTTPHQTLRGPEMTQQHSWTRSLMLWWFRTGSSRFTCCGLMHNFIQGATLQRLGLATSGGDQLWITVANGDCLQCVGIA
jgi:hypothetical protein